MSVTVAPSLEQFSDQQVEALHHDGFLTIEEVVLSSARWSVP